MKSEPKRKAALRITTLFVLLAIGLIVPARAEESKSARGLRLLLAEAQPGEMASEHDCMLVFADRHFHVEKAIRKLGNDQDRKVYEGELAEGDWNALQSILDSPEFRQINVPASAAPPVVQDAHTYTISVARANVFQNMEFLDNKSRKPYESRLKPLLQWWKAQRGKRMTAEGTPDSRCSSRSGLFSY